MGNVLRMELGSHIPRVKEIQERLRMDVILVQDQMELLGTGHWRLGLVLVTLLVVEREDRGQIMEVQDKTVEAQDRTMEDPDKVMEVRGQIMEEVVEEDQEGIRTITT